MPRKPDKRIEQAQALYLKGLKLVDISKQLDLPEGTVRRWKSTYKWDNERSDKGSERSDKNKGAQPGNKNASCHGAPKKNSNAEKHGLFRKYLPEETFSNIDEIKSKSSLDLIWDAIQIQYPAIIKQWDSTLDSVTRPTHRELDRQIREIDEPFEVAGKEAMYPGAFGDPSEDCNCRCCLFQRAKWAFQMKNIIQSLMVTKMSLSR